MTAGDTERRERTWPSLLERTRQSLLLWAILSVAIAVTFALASAWSGQKENADSVWSINLWRSWRPFNTEISLPPASFILKFPVHLLTEAAFGPGSRALIAAVLVFQTITVLILTWTYRWFAREWGLHGDAWRVGTAVIATITVSSAWVDFTARAGFRNIEYALLLAAIPATVSVASSRSRPQMALATVAAGFVAYNDPTIVYVLVVPAVLLLGTRIALRRASSLETSCALLTAGVIGAYIAVSLFFEKAGAVDSDYVRTELVTVDRIDDEAIAGLHLLMEALGAYGLSWPGTALSALRVVLLVALTLFASSAFIRLLPNASSAGKIAIAGVVLLAVTVPLSLVASARADEVGGPIRYLLGAAGLLGILTLFATFGRAWQSRLVVAVTVLWAAIIGMGLGIDVLRGPSGTHTQLDHWKPLAVELERRGLEVGYAQYWAAQPLAYWSDGSLDVASFDCIGSEPRPDTPFQDRSLFDREADRSFHVRWDVVDRCLPQFLDQLFGPPQDTLVIPLDGVDGTVELRIYEGNVGLGVLDS